MGDDDQICYQNTASAVSKPQLYHLLQIIVYTRMVPPIESHASVRPTHFLNFSEKSQCGSVHLVSDSVTVFV